MNNLDQQYISHNMSYLIDNHIMINKMVDLYFMHSAVGGFLIIFYTNLR